MRLIMDLKSGKSLRNLKLLKKGGAVMDYFMDDSFLRKGKYLWDKIVFDEFFKSLEEFKDNEESENKKRSLIEFLIELKNAKREFLEEIGNLPMVMNCRVKGNSGSYFGGEQCAKFVSLIRRASEKYLSSLPGDNYKEGHIGYVIRKVRDKARKD